MPVPLGTMVALSNAICGCRYSALGQADSTMVMLRPCPAVAKHMQTLLQSKPQLLFTKQGGYNDFLDWYFKRTRYISNVQPGHRSANRCLSSVHPLPQGGMQAFQMIWQGFRSSGSSYPAHQNAGKMFQPCMGPLPRICGLMRRSQAAALSHLMISHECCVH